MRAAALLSQACVTSQHVQHAAAAAAVGRGMQSDASARSVREDARGWPNFLSRGGAVRGVDQAPDKRVLGGF